MTQNLLTKVLKTAETHKKQTYDVVELNALIIPLLMKQTAIKLKSKVLSIFGWSAVIHLWKKKKKNSISKYMLICVRDGTHDTAPIPLYSLP